MGRSLPKWALRALARVLMDYEASSFVGMPREISQRRADIAKLRAEIDRCLSPSKAVRAARKPRARKKGARKEAMAAIRAAVVARAVAHSFCESAVECESCGATSFDEHHADHFFGGASRRVDEAVETVWLLCEACDYAKTHSLPDAAHWLRRFYQHCVNYGYPTSRVEARLARIEAGLSGSTP